MVYYPTVSFVFFRCLMVHTLPSRCMALLEKVEKLSQTAICLDSNTHMEKYDFEEFWSKHWLYTDTFAIISNEIPVIPKLYLKLQFFMSKMLV